MVFGLRNIIILLPGYKDLIKKKGIPFNQNAF